MKETSFIEQNKKKWHEFEKQSANSNNDPDKLSDLFIQMTEDLSYARTFYPKRSVRVYLNYLAQKAFNSFTVKKEKKFFKTFSLNKEHLIFSICLFVFGMLLGFQAGFNLPISNKIGIAMLTGCFFSLPILFSTLREFFFLKLPLELYASRKQLLAAFLFFSVPVLIGVISSIIDPEFSRVIMGDTYINMTLENISNEDPMAVYKQEKETSMFLGITINNIRVAFLAFIFGVFYSVGTVFFLASNGIMLGAFQYFFKTKGLFLTSFLVIWIHGALEISAIIIAGGAGIVMGNGLLFPKTYTRAQSFQIHARRGMKILLGTVPLFIVAGFLEGFVTRHTEMSDLSKVAIIASSFVFILFYFVIYPRIVFNRNLKSDVLFEEKIVYAPEILQKYKERTLNDVFYDTFSFYRTNFSFFGGVLLKLILPLQFVFIALYFSFFTYYGDAVMDDFQKVSLALSFGSDFNWISLLLNVCLFSINIATVYIVLDRFEIDSSESFYSFWRKKIILFFLKALPITAVLFLIISTSPTWLLYIGLFVVPFILLIFPSVLLGDSFSNLFTSFVLGAKYWGSNLIVFITIGGLSCIFYLFGLLPIWLFLGEFIEWHTISVFENSLLIQNILYTFILTSYLHIILPLLMLSFGFQYFGIKDKEEAISLNKRLNNFGKSSKVYETRK